MAIIRSVLGTLILLIDWITTPRGIKRDATTQTAIDAELSGLTLYQYKACPFCVKVRRAAKRQSLKLATRDAKRSAPAKEELLAGGGILKVPCLRVEDQSGGFEWMYESDEIINYLETRFGTLNTRLPLMRIVEITREPVELYKILKFEGMVTTGGEAKLLIAAGEVTVNGEIETRRRRKMVGGDVLEFRGDRLQLKLDS